MSKHSKGPWNVMYKGPKLRPISVHSPEGSVCSFNFHRWDESPHSAQANARLIEAAPLLYDQMKVGIACLKKIQAELGFDTLETQMYWQSILDRIDGER